MARCQIQGCYTEVTINPKTGKANMLCSAHYKEVNGTRSSTTPKAGTSKSKVTKNYKLTTPTKYPNKKPKPPVKPKKETFVLRGHTLTINMANNIAHIQVDRYTRAVKFNEESIDVSGQSGKYRLEIKQGSHVLRSLLYQKKYERDEDFQTLQGLLMTL
jgi:hypothetical protein